MLIHCSECFGEIILYIKHKNTNNLGTKLIIEKMVFALAGHHVPSPQAKLQLDRTAKLQGDVNLFSFLRDLFWEFFVSENLLKSKMIW